MNVSFVKISPTQNVTLLVTDPVPRDMHAEIAAQMLEYDGAGGEQVGFLEPATREDAPARLQMMGGEFCGNATMSLGAYLAWREGLAVGARAEYRLEVSGANALVPCEIERREDAFFGTVTMPLPEGIETVRLETDLGAQDWQLVRLPGIAHIVVPFATGPSREEIERRIRAWNLKIGADALGVLRWNAEESAMEPIVYVPSTDSAVWERGCGSGTAALGCALAAQNRQSLRMAICQPGGTITADATWKDGRIAQIRISGSVRITAAGTAFLRS